MHNNYIINGSLLQKCDPVQQNQSYSHINFILEPTFSYLYVKNVNLLR